MIHPLPLEGVSTVSNIRKYNLLAWKWIDKKFDIKWMYLLCFIFVDAAFLLGESELFTNKLDSKICPTTIPILLSPIMYA